MRSQLSEEYMQSKDSLTHKGSHTATTTNANTATKPTTAFNITAANTNTITSAATTNAIAKNSKEKVIRSPPLTDTDTNRAIDITSNRTSRSDRNILTCRPDNNSKACKGLAYASPRKFQTYCPENQIKESIKIKKIEKNREKEELLTDTSLLSNYSNSNSNSMISKNKTLLAQEMILFISEMRSMGQILE